MLEPGAPTVNAWSATPGLLLPLQIAPCADLGRNVLNPRRDLVTLLTHRTAAAQVPQVLSMAFNLCGMAHRYASQLAFGAAGLNVGEPLDARTQSSLLARETFAEHIRRMGLQWPLVLDDADAATQALNTLQASPLRLALQSKLPDARFWEQANAWLQDQVLKQPTAEWWQRWQAEGAQGLIPWASTSDSVVARLLRLALAWESDWPAATPALPGPTMALDHDWMQWAEQALGNPTLALRPEWHGQCAHTGTWTRAYLASLSDAPDHTRATPLQMLASRLAECVRLVLAGTGSLTSIDALAQLPTLATRVLSPRAGCGLAQVEMARGLLIHVVEVAPDAGAQQPPLRYRVIAPTDWNFHSQGIAAQALAHARAKCDTLPLQSLALLMAALDPCVPYVVQAAPEVAHA